MSVSLFVASLDSAGLSLVTCEFLLFSGVNFETSGLVFYCWANLENKLVSEAKSGRPLCPIDIVCFLNMMVGGHFQRIGGIVGGIAQSAACIAINK